MKHKVFFSLLLIIGGLNIVYSQNLSEKEVKLLLDTACSHYSEENYPAALSCFEKVSEYATTHPEHVGHDVVFLCQSMSILCHRQLKQYASAFDLARNVLKTNHLSKEEREVIEHHYVFCGYATALGKIKKSQYPEARELFNIILPVADADYIRRIIHYRGVSWYCEGMLYQEAQGYEQALDSYTKALSDFKQVSATDFQMETYRHIGEINNNLSLWYESLSSYLEAENLASSLKKDVVRMEILCELFELYDILGESESNERVSIQMDSIYQVTSSAKAKYAYQDFQGDQARKNKQYAKAERWYMRNAQLLPELRKADSYHGHYLNLRNLYSSSGNWDKAIRYAHLELTERQRGYTPADAEYYSSYGFIADIYRRQRDSLRCFHYLDSLFCSLPLTHEPRDIQHLYISRAFAHADFGNYDKALSDYRTADSILSTKYGPDDADRVSLLALMGGAEAHLKNYEEAERLYREYAGNILQLNGENSSKYVDALGYLANAEAFAGHMNAATRDYKEAAELLKRQTRSRWPYLNSSERAGYWAQMAALLNNMTPFALAAKENQTPFTTACYDGLIFTKAFLLESEQSTFDLVKKHGTEEDRELFSTIQSLQEKVRVWERSGNEYADSILNATATISRLESTLAKRCRAYGDATAFMDVNYAKVKQALGKYEVLLDFTDFVSESRGRIYTAYIIDGKQQDPLLKELFPERSIDSLNVRYPHQFYSGQYAERLLALLWEPLKQYVKEGSTVYYVPSQLLFQIALESLPAGDGTLLGDHYHFIRLSSARELIRYNATLDIAKDNKRSAAVLYGGLQYSLDGKTMAQEAQKHIVPRMLVFRGDDERVRGDAMFYELPGSKEEIDGVGRILQAARLGVTPYSGKEGTEESFLSLSGHAPQMVHFATHGFYYTPDAAQKVDYLRGFTDAMSLSGLVLSGGNAAWRGDELPEGVLGGILTAAEIARMDLSGVEMVVLSACHSGKGEATPEGLYGLQRAFKKAGVKTLVMSLWAESDVVAPGFMKAFYQNLTGEAKWDKHKAFDMARNSIRNKYPDSPSYWAGFIMLD